MSKKMANKTKIETKDVPFLAVLLLFAGFSLYGVLSFSGTLNEHVADQGYASVLNEEILADGGLVMTDEGEVIDPVTASEEIFTDVSGEHPYATAIAYFKEMGYVTGYEDGSFRPDRLLSRSDVFPILVDVMDVDFGGGVYEGCFDDVGEEWFAPFVCYAKDIGWTGGYVDGTFQPYRSATTAEATIMILTSLGAHIGGEVVAAPYLDVPNDNWAAKYAKAAKDAGMIDGEYFRPENTISRGLFIHMVYKAMIAVGMI
ncbi:S-layer homology domain-containing protein [Candidatus Peregrinibacteria bacterium]|jgi:hypothetical protein|nr:S-layer homology domain-containing protein [Candidatus Peregrinibacteria bacterium]MBT4055730.1 S-layer homology domain-containing protein [Candidatus Peregrinibacteria bacterium]